MKAEEEQATLQFDREQAEKRGHNEQQHHVSSSEDINYSEGGHDEVDGEEYDDDEDEHVVSYVLI